MTGAVRGDTLPSGTFTPAPGAAAGVRMVTAQARFELRLLLRNGEQVLLALVIPVAALLGLTELTLIALPEPRVATAVPGVWTLAILSAAFTSLAIATAFDRRYAVTKRLLAVGVPRRTLLAGKSVATAVLVAVQLVVLSVVAAMLGWRPDGSVAVTALAVLLGAAAFTGLGLLVGGTLKAETVLAVANLIWLALVAVGGVVVPLADAPGWLAAIGTLTPAGALSEGLRAATSAAPGLPVRALAILACWALGGWYAAVKWFRWQ